MHTLNRYRGTGPTGRDAPETRDRDTVTNPGYDPSTRSTPQLLQEWAAIMRELRHRDVVRTNNNPVGDIAEAIVHEYYGGERGGFSQAGWDIRSPEGHRIQVKGMRLTPTTKSRNLSPIRDSDYDFVVVVIFNEDFHVIEALRMSRNTVEEQFSHRAYVNGRIISVTAALRQHPGVEIVDLVPAYHRLHS
ncbi:hypothetical protein GCM10011410_23200 [Hoyosella rhizosphaerae]|uniref:DUF6998 domain-containing protein n=1 Tax=Hoyosella rhizosphaerae TaxID=1755582 RepID=A0A916UEN4_9ACTN|nr:hypothetical protein GCM10011410_23200 [Hoyosella rhizosphaerae]